MSELLTSLVHIGGSIGHRSVARASFLGLLMVLVITSMAEAVTVTPNALYIDARTRSATLTLFNPGNLPEEIEISFAYGYPRSDREGNLDIMLVHPDSVADGEPSAAHWLRAFPQRLILQPGQRQVVRILAQPPEGLADGEYWGRVLVLSRGGQPPIEQREGDVTMRLAVETMIVNSVNYRQGPLSTGVQVDGSNVERADRGLTVTFDLTRTGTAAYLGRLRMQILSPGGAVIRETEDNLAVYRTIRRRFFIPTDEPVPPGSQIRYVIETVRPDLPAGGALRAAPVGGTLPIS